MQLVEKSTACFKNSAGNPEFKFPPPNLPGLPNLILSMNSALLAGVNYTLKGMNDIPNFKVPSKSFFLDAAMQSVAIPFEVNLPIFGIKLGPVNSSNNFKNMDSSGFGKVFVLFVMVPFMIFKELIEKFLTNLTLPSLSLGFIQGLFYSVGQQLSLPPNFISTCASCIAKAILDLLKTFLPIP